MVQTPVEKKITKKDWDTLAAYIADEAASRRNRRKEREKTWEEIDRQVRMEAKPSNLDAQGRAIEGTEWMPFIELPLQAESLELLAADTRRILFPVERNYFSAHASIDDEFLEEFKASLDNVMGENDGPFVSQDNIDKIIEGVHTHYQDKYGFRSVWDRLNISAFKYGTFVGRGRMVDVGRFTHEFRGKLKNGGQMPVLVAMPVKNVLLDDSASALSMQHHYAAPAHIFEFFQKLDDIALAANRGSKDPDDFKGGWMPRMLKNLEPYNKQGDVKVMEWEGDILIPRSGPSIFLKNVIVTAVVGKNDEESVARIIRFRRNPLEFSSYIIGKYHEDQDGPYASSPMEKGMPLQKAATEGMNRFLQAAVLNTEPPISYPADDPYYATNGPRIAPRELWPTTGEINPQFIGDPQALVQAYFELVQQYQDVLGVTRPRLGAQTKSHQTRFAIQSEIERGVLRTVDYARDVMHGPLRVWLQMEYELIRKVMSRPDDIYIPEYQAYLRLDRDLLPETVTYDVHGAAETIEEEQKKQEKMTVLQLLAQLEPLAIQAGANPLNWDKIRQTLIREAYQDADIFTATASSQGVSGPASAGPEVQRANGPDTDDPLVALAAGISGQRR